MEAGAQVTVKLKMGKRRGGRGLAVIGLRLSMANEFSKNY
jgi:hypothetical protein